jgi:hypothetical protein
MISSTNKLLTARNLLIRQARLFNATAAAASPVGSDGRFIMKNKPKALDHKLWKNALEVS